MANAHHLHIDALGGIAGDMFLAATLHAAPELFDEVQRVAAAIGPGVEVSLLPAKEHGLVGHRMHFQLPTKDRGPRHYFDYVSVLRDAAPDAGVASRAEDIIERLGRAEARVHGVDLSSVHFHEISDWDSIADVLLAALMLERLGISSASIAPVPLGSGRVMTEHGIMPVPAPATLELLRGIPVFDDGIVGERVTPTGAAILAHLGPSGGMDSPAGLCTTGYGFGTKSFNGIANFLRLSTYQGSTTVAGDQVGVVTFHVDDQTPEDLAMALMKIRATTGVLDVLQYAALGKKGRQTSSLEIICTPERLRDVVAVCFAQTTTIGLRVRRESRALLPRASRTVTVGEVCLRVKSSARGNERNLHKVEADDLAQAEDQVARDDLRFRAHRSS